MVFPWSTKFSFISTLVREWNRKTANMVRCIANVWACMCVCVCVCGVGCLRTGASDSPAVNPWKATKATRKGDMWRRGWPEEQTGPQRGQPPISTRSTAAEITGAGIPKGKPWRLFSNMHSICAHSASIFIFTVRVCQPCSDEWTGDREKKRAVRDSETQRGKFSVWEMSSI